MGKKWIKTSERLPEEGKFVLARHNKENWISKDPNANCVVVMLERGISKKERELMRKGELDCGKDEYLPLLDCEVKRYYIYNSSDEHGNNLVPYSWQTFGPQSFFGQEITHWMPIEPLNE
jgi:hypothetical protein